MFLINENTECRVSTCNPNLASLISLRNIELVKFMSWYMPRKVQNKKLFSLPCHSCSHLFIYYLHCKDVGFFFTVQSSMVMAVNQFPNQRDVILYRKEQTLYTQIKYKYKEEKLRWHAFRCSFLHMVESQSPPNKWYF